MPQSATEQSCTYCGLPVVAESAAPESPAAPLYCCYGCRFAHAVVQEQGDEGAIRWTVIRLGLAIFFTMNLMAFTMTMWSLDVYEVEADPFQRTLYQVFRWLSMLLALPVLLLLGVPLLQNAVESWRRKVYSTDLLIVLAVIAAYLTSVVNVVRESGTVYFEVGATVLVMITLGRWIEAAGKQKATESLDKLLTLLPETVTQVHTNGEEYRFRRLILLSAISCASVPENAFRQMPLCIAATPRSTNKSSLAKASRLQRPSEKPYWQERSISMATSRSQRQLSSNKAPSADCCRRFRKLGMLVATIND